MSNNIKNMPASVRARLKNIAKKENINFNQILLLYLQERLLYRISISSYKNKFFLKCGLLILSLTEFKTRPTKDIDFLARGISNDLEDIKELFREVCDIIIPKPQTMDYPVFLDDQERPNIKTYSLESVIAEKFEAMLRLSTINSRMKDFYDIYIISEIKDFDGRVLQEAIFSTLQKRGTPLEANPSIFTRKFFKDKTRLRMWEGYLKRIGKDIIKFSRVMERINIFLYPIYTSIIQEGEYFKIWSHKRYCWK